MIYCPNCNNALEDGTRFCNSCGTQIPENIYAGNYSNNYSAEQFAYENMKYQEVPYQNNMQLKMKESTKKLIKMITSAVGMISGIISIILGFVMNSKYSGSYGSFENYGGDAYTGIQNAAARTASNVRELSEIVEGGFCFLLIVIGIALICYFGLKFMENVESV